MVSMCSFASVKALALGCDHAIALLSRMWHRLTLGFHINCIDAMHASCSASASTSASNSKACRRKAQKRAKERARRRSARSKRMQPLMLRRKKTPFLVTRSPNAPTFKYGRLNPWSFLLLAFMEYLFSVLIGTLCYLLLDMRFLLFLFVSFMW